MKMIGFGDMMLRLNPPGYVRFIQADHFEINYTGAEANVCVALRQYGVDAGLVTKLPDNDIARCAIACLRKYGVNTEQVVWGGERMGVFYLEKGASQRASKVIYDRKHTAIAEAKQSDFDWPRILAGVDAFHFTGITAALSDGLPAILEDALKQAKAAGALVSCDLNYRKNLWSKEKAKAVMEKLLPYVDVLIANEEDAEKVLGISAADSNVESGVLSEAGYIEVAKTIADRYGIGHVAISLRQSLSASDNIWSAMLYADGNAWFSKKYTIHLVDRVGGGDSFAAGLIFGLGCGWDPAHVVEFAAAASCLKQTIESDFNLASLDEIEALMAGDASGRVKR